MHAESPATVLVVDDHATVRHGISSLIESLRPNLCSAGAAATPEEAIELTRILQPHIVLLDVNLAGDDGLSLIPTLRSLAPCRVVVLTSLSDPKVLERALDLGAVACIRKTAPAGELIAALLSSGSSEGGAIASITSNEGSVMSRLISTKSPMQSVNFDDVSTPAVPYSKDRAITVGRVEETRMLKLLTSRLSDATAAITSFIRNEDAVTAIEYGLLASLIAVACIGALKATGSSISSIYAAWSAAVIAALSAAL